MTDQSRPRISAAFVREERAKAEGCWFHKLLMSRVMAEFTRLEAQLMNNSATLTNEELRSLTGQLAGLRTVLTLPHTIVQEAAEQENASRGETDDEHHDQPAD